MVTHVEAFGFSTPSWAVARLRHLIDVADAQVGIADAVAISWEAGGSGPIWTQLPTKTDGAGSSLDPEFWHLVVGLLYRVPLLNATSGEIKDDPLLASDPDIDHELVNALRDELIPGTSILFTIGTPEWVAEVERVLGDVPDEQHLGRFVLSPHFEAVIQAARR